MKSEIETLKQLLAEEKQKNTLLQQERDDAYRQLETGVADAIDAETELECISDVVTGRRPPEDFQPARGVLGEVIKALVAGGSPFPSEAPSGGSDKALFCQLGSEGKAP